MTPKALFHLIRNTECNIHSLAYRDCKDRMAHTDMAGMVHKVHMVHKVGKVDKGHKVHRDRMVRKGHTDYKG